MGARDQIKCFTFLFELLLIIIWRLSAYQSDYDLNIKLSNKRDKLINYLMAEYE
jgi:hypothetical protein